MVPGIIAWVKRKLNLNWYLNSTLNHPDPKYWDMFGSDVAISGDYAVFAADGFDDNGVVNVGRVYVYRRNGSMWEMFSEIPNPNLTGNNFGQAVAIHKNTLVISARATVGSAIRTGVVYVYELVNNSWVFQYTIMPPVPQSFSGFGILLDVYDEHIAVSAYSLDLSGFQNVGEVYVFVKNNNTWNLQATLGPQVVEHNRHYGSTLSIYGDYLVVGDNELDIVGNDTGGIDVYKRTGINWVLESTIPNPEPDTVIYTGGGFIKHLDLNNNLLVVGSVNCVYVFELSLNTWNLIKTITHPTSVVSSFGERVAVSGNNIAIADDDSVYLYARKNNAWSLQSEFSNPTPGSYNEYYGNLLALDKNYLIVSTMAGADDFTGEEGSGTAYIYHGTSNEIQWPLHTLLVSPTEGSYLGHSYEFGGYVSMSGKYVAASESRIGQVHVYVQRGDNWVLDQTIFSPSVEQTSFGTVTAMYDNTLIIVDRAVGYSQIREKIWIYTRSGDGINNNNDLWSIQGFIENPTTGSAPTGFGRDIAVDNNNNLVVTDSQLNLVYVYQENNGAWELVTTIQKPDHAPGTFGFFADISGEFIAICSPHSNTVGKVYVYKFNGTPWLLHSTLTDPSGIYGTDYGYSLAIYDNTIAVSAVMHNVPEAGSGAVYVYDLIDDIWTLTASILNPQPFEYANFGDDINIYQNYMTISSYMNTVSGVEGAGSVFIYRKIDNVWTLQTTINNPNTTNQEWSCFGWRSAIRENYLITGDLEGRAHIYKYTPDEIDIKVLPQKVFPPVFIQQTLPVAATTRFGAANRRGLFIILYNDSSNQCLLTKDRGHTWSASTLPVSSEWREIAVKGGFESGEHFFIAIGGYGTSTVIARTLINDGVNWTQHNALNALNTRTWINLTYGNGKFFATTQHHTDAATATSWDGINWTIQTTNLPFASVQSWSGDYFFKESTVAVGNNVFVCISWNVARTSWDGVTWTAPVTLPFIVSGNPEEKLIFANNIFLLVSGTRLITSANGVDWIEQTVPASVDGYILAGGGGYFVLAPRSSGPTYMSTDTVNWVNVNSPIINVRSVVYGNGRFVFTGTSTAAAYVIDV